ncbi:site-specific DNA-methyltransferase [Vibrio chagasii]|uniref:site-specific DNA-methyltransferase n=1 Tax=Vibrio chagasii TaxID=170679 RepID=UPI0038CE4E9E
MNKKIKELHKILEVPEARGPKPFSYQDQLRDFLFDKAPKQECLLMSGDNLDSLSQISSLGNSLADLCYVDPPYNTRNKFIYNDSINSTTSGTIFGSHQGWMSFMLPRLQLVHKMLKSSGFIVVSIDDNEYPYLKILLDVLFGDKNYIGSMVVCRSKNGKGSSKNIAVNHEYLVIYSKSQQCQLNGLPEVPDDYCKSDEFGYYKVDGQFRKNGADSLRSDRPNMFYPLYYDKQGKVYVEQDANNTLAEILPIDRSGTEKRWLWSKEKAKKDSWMLKATATGNVYVKNYYNESKRKKARSLMLDNAYLSERGTNELKQIFGNKIFDTPKPLKLLEDVVDLCTPKEALVVDIFAGSGTMAHSVFNLNRYRGANRSVILMEQDNPLPTKLLATREGYNSILDITQKRLDYLKSKDHHFDYKILK